MTSPKPPRPRRRLTICLRGKDLAIVDAAVRAEAARYPGFTRSDAIRHAIREMGRAAGK